MSWKEQQAETRVVQDVDPIRANVLDNVKKENLSIVQKEADDGVRPFETVHFQPIKGIDTFEAEFGVKGDDVVIHIWPYGYHDADRDSGPLPNFNRSFESFLRRLVSNAFGEHRVQISYDGDVGAWFVIAKGFSSNQFYRDLCIEMFKSLHILMGGKV